MIRFRFISAFCIAALAVMPAAAQTNDDTWFTSHRSGMQILPTDEQGCVAEIQIKNRQTDFMPSAGGQLVLGDLTVAVTYRLNAGPLGAERYFFAPPDGYIAVPMEIEVQDDDEDFVMICPWVGF